MCVFLLPGLGIRLCIPSYIKCVHLQDYSIYTQLAKKYVACLDSVYGRKLLTSLSAEDNCDTAFGLAVGATQQFGVCLLFSVHLCDCKSAPPEGICCHSCICIA